MKTVIPAKVVGKFSIRWEFVFIEMQQKTSRIVPNMVPAETNELVVAYMNKVWQTRGTQNKLKFVLFINT